jgi:hypothetical protein
MACLLQSNSALWERLRDTIPLKGLCWPGNKFGLRKRRGMHKTEMTRLSNSLRKLCPNYLLYVIGRVRIPATTKGTCEWCWTKVTQLAPVPNLLICHGGLSVSLAFVDTSCATYRISVSWHAACYPRPACRFLVLSESLLDEGGVMVEQSRAPSIHRMLSFSWKCVRGSLWYLVLNCSTSTPEYRPA